MTLCQYYPKKYFTTVLFRGTEEISYRRFIFSLRTFIYFLWKRKREYNVSYFEIQNYKCCKFKEMAIIRSGENFTKGKLNLHKSNLRDKSVNSVRNESSGSNHNTSFSVERGLPLNNTFQESYPTYKFR